MSINFSRHSKALNPFSDHVISDGNATSVAVVGSSHLEHIFSVWFFKPEEWSQKLAHFRKKVAGKFDAVKRSSRWLALSNGFNASEHTEKRFYKRFIDTLDLKLQHVLILAMSVFLLAFSEQETTIAIDQACEVNQVFSSEFRPIKERTALTHNHPFVYCSSVQNGLINIHRDRLSEWTSKGDAIVGP